jgi:HEAT repeat protein
MVKKKCILFISFLFFNNIELYPDQSLTAEDQILLNTLDSIIGVSSDSQTIHYLQRLKKIPEHIWQKVIFTAISPNHSDLRNYIFVRFSDDIPYFEEKTDINRNFLNLCKNELHDFIKKDIPSKDDIFRIFLVLENIKKRKIQELLPEVSMLIAYSLYDVRKAASETIFEIKDDRLLPVVLSLAQSENPVERTYAVDALYYLKDERTTPVLLQLLNDKNKSVRYYTIRSLDSLNVPEAIPFYIRILKSDSNDEVRILSAKVLGKLKPPAAFNTLLDSVFDPNPHIRDVVLDALFEYNFSAAAIHVSKQLSIETVDNLKIKEIKLLLSLNNSGLMTGLGKVVKDDSNFKVRLWGIYAVGILLDPMGYELLLLNLENENPLIREEAALALANFKYKKTVSHLLTLVKNINEDYNVQAAALFSLKNIDDNTCIPELYELSINHLNIAVRAEIKNLLRDMLFKRFR